MCRWNRSQVWGSCGNTRRTASIVMGTVQPTNEITRNGSYIPNRIHWNSRRQVIVFVISCLERWVCVSTWNLITGKPLIKPPDTWQCERGNCTNKIYDRDPQHCCNKRISFEWHFLNSNKKLEAHSPTRDITNIYSSFGCQLHVMTPKPPLKERKEM